MFSVIKISFQRSTLALLLRSFALSPAAHPPPPFLTRLVKKGGMMLQAAAIRIGAFAALALTFCVFFLLALIKKITPLHNASYGGGVPGWSKYTFLNVF